MASWHQWRDGVFGDPYLVWHEGPDFTELLALARAEPGEVAGMLAAGLDAADPVAAVSYAALADEGLAPEGAEALLRAAAAGATGTFLVRVAQALHRVTGDESWAAPVASVLASDLFWGARIDAAMALTRFAPTGPSIEALGDGVRCAEYLVRYHCANTLLRYAGGTRDVGDLRGLFAGITDGGDHGAAADRLTRDASRVLRERGE